MRLRDLLTEIQLGSAAPYTTQFVWQERRIHSNMVYTAEFDAAGTNVLLRIQGSTWYPDEQEGPEYVFSYWIPNTTGFDRAFTYSHDLAADTQINYFRLMTTMGEAILDFCTQYSPAAIDVTGDDMDPDRARQKTRIYANLLRQNAARLSAAGYDVLHAGRKLEIVRNTRFDASGIDTPNNPNM
jgi:hypothetical protein